MKIRMNILPVVVTCLLLAATVSAGDDTTLQGTWRVASYLKASNGIRYQTDGYMMFGKEHWLHVMFFNRDERQLDFSESHHGTYRITGPDTLDLDVDMELHMDPKTELQDTPIWYGKVEHLKGDDKSLGEQQTQLEQNAAMLKLQDEGLKRHGSERLKAEG